LSSLSESFEERLAEINAYLDLLAALDAQAQTGPPVLGGKTITAQQQKILYSAVYLQLYNLVEATMLWCMQAVASAASRQGKWLPGDLSEQIRREWVRTIGRTHSELNVHHRYQTTLELCDWIIAAKPVSEWEFERRGAGSWDDFQIEDMAKRIGCDVSLSPMVRRGIKEKIRNDKSPLPLIRDFRNRLAHGSLSFTECGEATTVGDLVTIKDSTANYLREIVAAFDKFIAEHGFLLPSKRPAPGAIQ
jgi:hypothetical protein